MALDPSFPMFLAASEPPAPVLCDASSEASFPTVLDGGSADSFPRVLDGSSEPLPLMAPRGSLQCYGIVKLDLLPSLLQSMLRSLAPKRVLVHFQVCCHVAALV